MSWKRPRRKYRIRRKRRHDGLGETVADRAATEVVGEFGCCLVEAVVGATVLAALIAVPAQVLLR